MVNLFGPLRTFIVRWTFIVFCTVNIFLVNRKRGGWLNSLEYSLLNRAYKRACSAP